MNYYDYMLTLPGIISGLIRLLLVLAAIGGFFATIICLPIGLTMFFVKHGEIKKGNELKKKKFYKLVKLLVFGGPCLVVATFVIWAIISLIGVFFGFKLITPIV